VSVLFIKYFPDLGVQYDYWNGERSLVGVGVNKNGLGRLCLVAGVFGLWDVIALWHDRTARGRTLALFVGSALLALTLWLLVQSDSATSLLTLLIGFCIILGFGLPVLRKSGRYLGILTILAGLVLAAILLSSDLLQSIVLGLGRNMTFTTRTSLWNELWSLEINPLVGVGYDSFWLGDRLNHFIEKYNVNTAHDGYLEAYLELGIVGMLLLAGLVLSVFRRAKSSLRDPASFDFGRVQLAILAIFLLYNVTEVAYKARTLIFFLLLLVGVGFPRRRSQALSVTPRARTDDANSRSLPNGR
jgi:exopolysaccharide production protein ExoQ